MKRERESQVGRGEIRRRKTNGRISEEEYKRKNTHMRIYRNKTKYREIVGINRDQYVD